MPTPFAQGRGRRPCRHPSVASMVHDGKPPRIPLCCGFSPVFLFRERLQLLPAAGHRVDRLIEVMDSVLRATLAKPLKVNMRRAYRVELV